MRETQPLAPLPEPLSDAMSVRELARLFGFGRDKMAAVLEAMPGAERFGGKWRLPVSKMPVSWLLDAGLIVPQLIELPAIQGHSDRGDSVGSAKL